MMSVKETSLQKSRRLVAKWISLGLCRCCGSRPPKEGKKRCQQCCDVATKYYNKKCKTKKYRDARNKKNRDRWNKNKGSYSQSARKHRQKLKHNTMTHYGGKCACCGEDKIEFLAIDHINGGGNKHRKQEGMGGGYFTYKWLRDNNYPKDFRVLCHNCNQSIGNYGYCPHGDLKVIND